MHGICLVKPRRKMFLKNGDCSEEESPSAWQTGCDSQSPWTLSLQWLTIFKHRHQRAPEEQDVNGESAGTAQPRSDSWGDSTYISIPNARCAAFQGMRSWRRAPERVSEVTAPQLDFHNHLQEGIGGLQHVPRLQGGMHGPMQSQCPVSRKNNESSSVSQTLCPVHVQVFCGLECWAQKCWRWPDTSPVPCIGKGTKEGVEAIHALENLWELQRLLHLGTKGP